MPQLPTLFSSSYGLLGSYAVSAELHGVTLKDRNLRADHLEQFHTDSSDQHLHRKNHVVPKELLAPLWCYIQQTVVVVVVVVVVGNATGHFSL